MGHFDFIPTAADLDRELGARRAPQKGVHPVVARQNKRDEKKANGDTFRKAVWKEDKGICRATGVKLSHSGTDPHTIGEVDHAYQRSTHPERIYDVSNGILISKYLNRLRKAVCRNAPEHKRFSYTGPDDRRKPQKFVWRDDDGKITKTRIG